MTKDEFINDYSKFGHRTDARYESSHAGLPFSRWNLDKVHAYFDAVSCDCGHQECKGWKMRAKSMDPPENCSVDPMTLFGPFGPPFTMMDPEQPSISFTSSDDEIQPIDKWKRLADVKPAHGQLVEYRGVNSECARKEYADIGVVPRKGHFTTDCGTSWDEQLDGFTTEKLGVIVAPDPEITFWRAVIDWDKDTALGSAHCLPILKPADEQPKGEGQLGEGGEFFPIGDTEIPALSFTDPPTGMTGSPDSGMASKEPIGLRGADFPFHWSFILEGKTVGELTFNEKTEKLELSGDTDATAKILFDLVRDQFEVWHKEKYGE